MHRNCHDCRLVSPSRLARRPSSSTSACTGTANMASHIRVSLARRAAAAARELPPGRSATEDEGCVLILQFSSRCS